MSKRIEAVPGQRYGNWTVVGLDRTDGHRTWWNVICDCGNATTIRSDSIRLGGSGKCLSCQSNELKKINTRHGQSNSVTWRSWKSMRERCAIPTSSAYPNYGGRGIEVCARWEIYENFVADMGERKDGMTLDRIDPNGNYTPENCRWATAKQQSRNKRKTVFLTANDQTKSLADWAEERGVRHITFYKRYDAGWSDDAIVNTPIQPPNAPKRIDRSRALT
jgi:hypothetical protein